jgi:hypothetical protein
MDLSSSITGKTAELKPDFIPAETTKSGSSSSSSSDGIKVKKSRKKSVTKFMRNRPRKSTIIGAYEEKDDETKLERYPADSYSFMAVRGYGDPICFYFALLVVTFQILFLLLLIFSVTIRKINSEMIIDDNPSQGLFAQFITSNVSNVARVSQFVAILSYCIFSEESLNDVVTGTFLFYLFCFHP